ncbi:hypothetical protein RRG08_041412 [Elysia crispata]|uniref:Uncharacterized protein n=1 Tax=Elysia crispata TaxID=231223 RepID=A0AAE1CKQ9_9GAST|nr:hypothetical protein RRG08_041412 [Elysia crispata]
MINGLGDAYINYCVGSLDLTRYKRQSKAISRELQYKASKTSPTFFTLIHLGADHWMKSPAAVHCESADHIIIIVTYGNNKVHVNNRLVSGHFAKRDREVRNPMDVGVKLWAGKSLRWIVRAKGPNERKKNWAHSPPH